MVNKSDAGEVFWTHNGEIIRSDDRHYTTLNAQDWGHTEAGLEISDVTGEQAGYYEAILLDGACDVRNIIEVHVEGEYCFDFYFCLDPFLCLSIFYKLKVGETVGSISPALSDTVCFPPQRKTFREERGLISRLVIKPSKTADFPDFYAKGINGIRPGHSVVKSGQRKQPAMFPTTDAKKKEFVFLRIL